jgi:hypothetical protein
MPTTSAPYFAFLILVFFGYWLLAERHDWRIIFLAVASCFFYSHAGPMALMLLLAVSAIDFTTSRLMVRSSVRSSAFRAGVFRFSHS